MDGTVSYEGGSIAYEILGSGSPALIFIHGWSCNRSHWRASMDALAPLFQVVAIDLGGHGASSAARNAWTIDTFGADVGVVVTHLQLKRVVLIGHSMGGDVAVAAARRMPERVAGIVWVDTYKRLGTVRTAAQLEEILAPLDRDFARVTRERVRAMFPPDADPALAAKLADEISAAPPEIARPALASSLAYAGAVTQALQELKLPVVAINAAEPATNFASMARYGVDVLPMTGVGHFPMLEKPAAFNAILASVVERFV